MKIQNICFAAAATLALGACAHTETKPATAPPPAKAVAQKPTLPPPPPEKVPALQLPKDVKPVHYTLNLKVNPDQKTYSGTEAIEIALSKPRQVIWLHGRQLKVTSASIEVGGKPVSATYAQVNHDGVVKLTLASVIPAGKATLRFAWSRPFEHDSAGLYISAEKGIRYAYTQFESIYARRAFPSFDEPAFKTPYDVTVTVPEDDLAVGNTPIAKTRHEPDGMKQVTFQTTKPLPTYLVAIAVGPFDVVQGPTLPANAIRSWPVPTRGITPKGRGDEVKFALKVGAKLIQAEERYFGIAYPYPKLDHIAVPDFEAGAMENAGAITYREPVLLYRPGIDPPTKRLHIAKDMAHEMAHQWFGDYVTLPWWTDTWLNEAFATWMGTRTVASTTPELGPSRGQLLAWITGAMHMDSIAAARAIRQPLAEMDQVEDQFDSLTYAKGAATLGMFERWIGKDKFRQGIHDYLVKHAWGSGDTDDLMASLSKAAGRDVGTPFKTFLDQPGLPQVSATLSCQGKSATLKLSQSRYAPLGATIAQGQRWQIPVCVRYGKAGKTHESCTLLDQPTGVIALEGGCPSWVIPNAGAVGYYAWTLDSAALKKLQRRGIAELEPLERISLVRNLQFARSAGALSFGQVESTLASLTHDSNPQVATAAMGLLSFARWRLVPASMRKKVDAYGQKLYRPLLRKLGWTPKPGESFATRRLRARVISFLAFSMQDPRVRRKLARLGVAYADVKGGKFDVKAVPPMYAGSALGVAVQEKGQKLFDALEARLTKLNNARLRGQVLGALGSTRDPKLGQEALALTVDPRLRTNERGITLRTQLEDPRTQEAGWSYFKASFDQILPLLSPGWKSHVPMIGRGFCDEAHADEVKQFFTAKLPELHGAQRSLRQVLEGMHVCIAEKQAEAASAKVFFAHHR